MIQTLGKIIRQLLCGLNSEIPYDPETALLESKKDVKKGDFPLWKGFTY